MQSARLRRGESFLAGHLAFLCLLGVGMLEVGKEGEREGVRVAVIGA